MFGVALGRHRADSAEIEPGGARVGGQERGRPLAQSGQSFSFRQPETTEPVSISYLACQRRRRAKTPVAGGGESKGESTVWVGTRIIVTVEGVMDHLRRRS